MLDDGRDIVVGGINSFLDPDNFTGNLPLAVFQKSPQTLRHSASSFVLILKHLFFPSPFAFRITSPSLWQFPRGKSSAVPWTLWPLDRPALPFLPWRIFRDLPKTYRYALHPLDCGP